MDWDRWIYLDDHYIYYCGKESLWRNGVAIIVNKRFQNAVLGCNLKNDRMISVRFQGKPFNITVIQVYDPTSNAEEAEVERFYEDPQELLELTRKQMSNAVATLIILKHRSYLKSFNRSHWIQDKIQHFNLNHRLYLIFHLALTNSKFYVKWSFM